MHTQAGIFDGRSQTGVLAMSATAESAWYPDIARIAPKLWIGSVPEPADEWSDRGGFDLIVLCAREYQPRSHNFPGTQVLHAGFDDALWPSPNDYDVARCAAEVVSEELAKGRRVLVTCMQGRNRSGLVCARTLWLNGATGAEALRMVQRMRPHALTNQKFAAYLRALA